jgi:hypothetical protein
MALLTATGTLDLNANMVLPDNTGTWADLTTWDTFTSWITAPANPLIYLSDIQDLGEVRDFCLKIVTDAVGSVEYTIYTSNTGAFAGEETTTTVAQNATGVASFTARYYIVAISVTQTSGLNVLNGFETTVTGQTISIDINAVDTSTLAGTSSARTLVLPRSVSKIVDMQVTPQAVTAYNLDVYVTDYASCTTVIPRVISKSISTPQIALIGLDNIARDAVVDVHIRALPEMYMSGNNLLVR